MKLIIYNKYFSMDTLVSHIRFEVLFDTCLCIFSEVLNYIFTESLTFNLKFTHTPSLQMPLGVCVWCAHERERHTLR